VTASTTTTIRGVSIFSRQRKRKADVFDIALSPEGIVIRRPGRTEQHMTWERIAQWELEERSDCLVLTLRGGGSVTPLMVKGWTLEDLETVMRDATEGKTEAEPETDDTPAPLPEEALPPAVAAAVFAPEPVAQPVQQPAGEPVLPRAARRQATRRPRRRVGKSLVTLVLLGILATAVVVVLLQSAGVISWSFLGPVA
jgi:hypothetical protein